jgi:hypothetical protein
VKSLIKEFIKANLMKAQDQHDSHDSEKDHQDGQMFACCSFASSNQIHSECKSKVSLWQNSDASIFLLREISKLEDMQQLVF